MDCNTSASEDYLAVAELKDRHSYKILGRNAYAGIWLAEENSFIIARYKVGPNPYIHYESHWDFQDLETGIWGTAKPVTLIGPIPDGIHQYLTNGAFGVRDLSSEQEQRLLAYLEKLEEDNPIEEGKNTLQGRKQSAIAFLNRLRRRD